MSIKLTLESLQSFMQEIPIDTPPRTFREAITITRHLGLDYLWIDSLCIIQGDDHDWARESALMQSVYGGSTINIAASSARDSTGGCLVKPDDFGGAFRAQIMDSGCYRVQDFSTHDYEHMTTYTTLAGRAWALQEKLMSPRTIHFGVRGAYWECRTRLASEHLPDGYTGQLVRPLVRRTDSLVDRREEIVRLYSGLALTFSKDRLPALAGIARQAYVGSHDQYLAGMWKGRLLEQLCWSRSGSPNNRLLHGAPTWSWASVDGQVWWFTDRDLDSTYVHVLNARATFHAVDPFGQVSGGVIRLACSYLIEARVEDVQNSEEAEEGEFAVALAASTGGPFTIMIDTLTDLEANAALPIYMVPIYSHNTYSGHSGPNDEHIPEQVIEGIVLRPTIRVRGEYTRIGFFKFYKDSNPYNDPDERSNENVMDPFIQLLESHGKETAEAACAEIIPSPTEHPDQRFVITII